MLTPTDALGYGDGELLRDLQPALGWAVSEDDAELVTADAGHGVTVAYSVAQHASNCREHGVTGIVSVTVIDGLELVEIEEHEHMG